MQYLRQLNSDIRFSGIKQVQWKRKELVLFTAVMLLALGLRLYFILGIEQPGLFGDDQNYDRMVRQLLDKKIYGYLSPAPNAYVTPGLPLFLALIYKLHGYYPASPIGAVRIYQALMLTAAVGFIYLIARKIRGPAAAFFAALIAAVYPPLIWGASAVLTETLFTFIFLAYVYVMLLSLERYSLFLSGFAGILFGTAVLTRPQVAPFFFIPFLIKVVENQRKDTFFKNRQVLSMFLVFSAMLGIVMFPWWLRNYLAFNKVILSATQTGNPLLAGTDPYFRLGVEKLFAGVPPEEQTSYAIKRIINGFRNETLLYLKWFTVGKFAVMYQEPWQRFTGDFMLSFKVLHLPVVIIGWLGLLFGMLKPRIRLLAAAAVVITLIQLVFLPLPRYVYPLMPILIIGAVYFIGGILPFLKELEGIF